MHVDFYPCPLCSLKYTWGSPSVYYLTNPREHVAIFLPQGREPASLSPDTLGVANSLSYLWHHSHTCCPAATPCAVVPQ